MCGSVFWLDRETCRTQKEKKNTENKQTRKAMSALKGSTSTTLARKQELAIAQSDKESSSQQENQAPLISQQMWTASGASS